MPATNAEPVKSSGGDLLDLLGDLDVSGGSGKTTWQDGNLISLNGHHISTAVE